MGNVNQNAGQAGDPATAYLARCASGEKGRELLMCMRSAEHQLLADGYRSRRRLDRPLFRPRSELASAAADTASLVTLLYEIRDRCFGGSAEAYLLKQGMPMDIIREILRGVVDSRIVYARPDMLSADGRLRIIEVNAGSDLGGLNMSRLNAALLAQDAFSAFAEEYRMCYVDSLESAANQLRCVAKDVVGTHNPVVALIEESGSNAACADLVRCLRACGLEIFWGELKDLSRVRGKMVLRDSVPVDVVFRYFFRSHFQDEPDGFSKLDMLVDAHRDGRTALFTGFDHEVYASKAAIGLLYEPEVSSMLSAEERALVERRIPWTRRLAPDGLRSDHAALIDECRHRRPDLIVKPALGSDSDGVIFGKQLTDREWTDVLSGPLSRSLIVQERIVPDSEDIMNPETLEIEPWHVNWGIYVTESGMGGTFVRGRRAVEDGVIGGHGNNTLSGCAFCY
ncbi:MAG: hypothetical protein HOY79_23985 [Streptomyces sp.]|nr:hypothetical protein [Streptomyces sp.]